MAGVAEHSDYRNRALNRLQRTAAFYFTELGDSYAARTGYVAPGGGQSSTHSSTSVR